MIRPKAKVPRILELADRIAADVARRELRPGDVYQGTAQTAEMLGVSTAAANRAMQVLVKRRVLERRQRKGTVVARPVHLSTHVPLARVHLLVHENFFRSEGLLADGVVIGMHAELNSVHMQFSFLPPGNDAPFVEELISQAYRSRQQEGFVAVRASLETQRLLAQGGLPTVVHGSLYPSVPHLPYIDRDHRQAGRLLVEHLLQRGFRKFFLLMRDRMLSGDHQLLDSIRDSLSDAGIPLSALTLRCLPAHQEAVVATAAAVLSAATEPLGVICRSEPLAQGVLTAADSLKLLMDRKIAIAVTDVYHKAPGLCGPWICLRSQLSAEQIGQHIGRMLVQQARGEVVQPDHEIIPVRVEAESV